MRRLLVGVLPIVLGLIVTGCGGASTSGASGGQWQEVTSMPAGSSTGDYHSEPFDLTGGAVKVHIVPACTGGFTGNIMKIWFVPQDGTVNPNQPEDVYINPNPEDAAYELYATPGSGDSKANTGEEPGPYQSGSYVLRVYTDTPSTITVSEQR